MALVRLDFLGPSVTRLKYNPDPNQPALNQRDAFVKTLPTDLFLIIDVQNDFCPGGALAVQGGNEIIALINQLTEHFDHMALTQDWHPAGHSSFASVHRGKSPFEMIEMPYGDQNLWPDHCVQGTFGAQFHPDLKTDKAAMIIRKGFRAQIDSYSAFFENDQETATGLTGYIHDCGFTRIFMAGLATDYCVGFSALDARQMGLDVVVIEDACRAINMAGSLAAIYEQFDTQGVVLKKSAEILGS